MPKKSVISTSDADYQKHRAVEQWLKIAPRSLGSRPREVQILKDRGHSVVYRLKCAGPGRTGVIAKQCRGRGAEVESAVYQDVIAYLGLPALRFYGCIKDDGPTQEERHWLFMEDAGEEMYSYSCREHRFLAGRWLAMLHCGAARLAAPPPIPQRSPSWYLGELRALHRSVSQSLTNPALNAADLPTLEAVLRQCALIESHWQDVVQFCEGMPQTLTHGDLSPKNTRIRACGPEMSLIAIDWETASWGVPAVDLGSLGPDLPTYLSATGLTKAVQAVERMAIAGRIFRSIISMRWEEKSLASHWPARAMRHITCYREHVADSIQAAGWGAT